jgi:FkbM family methyltransferase
MVVFDIGANIGIYTLAASKIVGSAGRVHSFEPACWPFNQLEKNVRLNNATNIVLNNIGASNRSGVAAFNICEDDAYNSIGAGPMETIVARENITITTLDDYSDRYGVTSVDVIKVDVEGADYWVLLGAERIIKKFSPVIFFEYNRMVRGFPFTLLDLENYLTDLDYKLHYIHRGKLIEFDRETCKESELIAIRSTGNSI